MSGAAIFVDTCFWIALVARRDQLSPAARQGWERARQKQASLVTTEMVLTEFLNMFSGRGKFWRTKAAELLDDLQGRDEIKIVEQSHEQFVEAFELYKKRDDKGWGVTDCASFLAMNKEGITEALTDDHHSEQARFVCLMTK